VKNNSALLHHSLLRMAEGKEDGLSRLKRYEHSSPAPAAKPVHVDEDSDPDFDDLDGTF
jgi:hypothetical protein